MRYLNKERLVKIVSIIATIFVGFVLTSCSSSSQAKSDVSQGVETEYGQPDEAQSEQTTSQSTSAEVDPTTESKQEDETTVDPQPPDDYNIFSGPNYTNRVVLTFDDCPSSYSELVNTVTVAQDNNIGLVLAPIGNCIANYSSQGQDIVQVARDHGQYVINHSVSHPALSTYSYSGIIKELSEPGVVTNFGRPPYGDGFFSDSYSPKVVQAYSDMGMKPWLWTVDTNDWQGKTAQQIVNYAVNHAGQGDTVLMHMNHSAFNPESVLAIRDGLNARGLEVCRAYDGVTPQMLPERLPC